MGAGAGVKFGVKTGIKIGEEILGGLLAPYPVLLNWVATE
jgi:hypothetical protein